MVCRECGLVQSVYSTSINPREILSLSSGADFGNVRYGKSFTTRAHMEILDKIVPWKEIKSVLDIGSNRGSFIYATYFRGDFSITAVEPDTRITPNYREYPRVNLIKKRIEDVDLTANIYDLIYSSHTFEHLKSPYAVFSQLITCSKKGTYFIVEVPNINGVTSSDVLEEWFIDAHTFHFSGITLSAYLRCFGWDVIYEKLNKSEITFTATWNGIPGPPDKKNSTEVAKSVEALRLYQKNRLRALAHLKYIVEYITSFYPKKIAIWGAGRIFDALVRSGNLDVKKIAYIVDSYLPQYRPTIQGMRIHTPEEVDFKTCDVIFIASRDYTNQIKEALALHDFRGVLLDFPSLMRQL